MKWLIVAAALLVVLILAVVLPRKSVRAEVVVDATPDEVWSVIMDTASYAEWNPILVSVDGTFAEGAELTIGMKTADGRVTPVSARVERLVPARHLNQTGGMTGILTFSHNWLLEPVEAGTRVTQYEEYRGVGVLFWNPAWVQSAYADGLDALNARLHNEGGME